MKKQLILIAATVITSVATAQKPEGNLIPCNTFNAMDNLFTIDPDAKIRYENAQTQLRNERNFIIENQTTLKTAGTVYTVPVVFHVLHQNGPENVSDATIIAALAQVNKDYRKQGSDIASISPLFSSLYVDAEIQFVLAKKDPTGKCTNGIVRHLDANTNWNQDSPPYPYSGNGTNRWPTNKYLNVYLVSCISSAQSGVTCPTQVGTSYVGGYTWLPGTWATNSANDAIVYRADLLVGTEARALSHEIGHWLDLYHTFGQTNDPGSYNCGHTLLNDFIGDTPETKGNFSTCPSSGGTNTCDASTNHNVENFMNYSNCPKMFTQGQVTAMRTALQSGISGRSNLWSNTNLTATGLSGALTCTPVANFSSNKTTICSNQSVVYTSSSQLGTSGSVSWAFQGGTPATSSATQVTVTYPSAGIYSVSLTANNGTGTNTLNKTSYLNTVNGGGGVSIPVVNSFEDGLIPSQSNVINNNTGSVSWAIKSGNGANSTTKSIFLNNITANTAGHIDIWETPIYNFSNITGATISYWYAYAKKTSAQADTFKLQYSLDCGGSWTNVSGFTSANTMATNSGGVTSSAFNPTSAQWKQTNIISALLTGLNNKPSVKFRFYFRAGAGGANNIYFDEINLSGTVSLNELENNIGLSIYPNPTNSTSTVEFDIPNNETAFVSVTDLIGRTVEPAQKLTSNGNHITHTVNKNNAFAKGIYFINIDINQQRISKKLIIE